MRRGVLAPSRALTACLLTALAVAAGGCTTGATSSIAGITGKTLSIYASVPSQTADPAQAQDILDAEQLALQQNGAQVGTFRIRFEPLKAKTTDNARTAIQDSSTIAYLGEVDPGASADSIPITEDQDVLQVSPSDTALAYTQPTAAVPGAPKSYYKEAYGSFGYTFARVVPSAALEAKAQVQEMRALGVTRLFVADDGSEYGKAIALAVKDDASPAITVVSSEGGADAVFYGGSDPSKAASVFNAAVQANPGTKLFGPSALDNATFAAKLTSAAQRGTYISAPGFLPADLSPSGAKFFADFKAAYGHSPALGAIFGYEAMEAVLSVLGEAGSAANQRATVVKDFFRIRDRPSVLGTYSLNSNGDPDIGPFVFSHFKDGTLVPFKFVQSRGEPSRIQGWPTRGGAGGVSRASGKRIVRLAVALAICATLAGCGASSAIGNRIAGDTLTIYESVPLHGASRVSAQAVIAGAQLALAQARNAVGRYHIVVRVLDDSIAARGQWDPGQTTLNAHEAAQDKTTIGYIGDFNSGASAISIPVLNRAGIAQITPASTAVGLTSDAPGAAPGEPAKYYPTGIRTYARVVPNDTVQAAAMVKLQLSSGCRKTYVLDDGEFDGEDTATTFQLTARPTPPAGGRCPGIRSHGDRLQLAGVQRRSERCRLRADQCADREPRRAAHQADRRRASRARRSSVAAGLAETTFTDPAQGGIPLAIGPRVLLTSPTLAPSATGRAAAAFWAAYDRGSGPVEPTAIFGYEAMKLMLSAIDRATDGGRRAAQRSKVVAAVFATRHRHSAIGTYSIDPDGDTTLTRYGVYRIVAGRLASGGRSTPDGRCSGHSPPIAVAAGARHLIAGAAGARHLIAGERAAESAVYVPLRNCDDPIRAACWRPRPPLRCRHREPRGTTPPSASLGRP